MAQVNTDQLVKKKAALTHQEQLANTYKQGAGDVLENIKNRGLTIAGNQKPGQSPGDDRSGDNRYDKDWPPKPPLKPKLATANDIKKTGGPLANDDAYGEGNVPNHPDWSGINNNMMIAGSMKDSLKRENVGNTLRDVVLPPAMREYGKTPSGGYKNPGALLSIMRKLV